MRQPLEKLSAKKGRKEQVGFFFIFKGLFFFFFKVELPIPKASNRRNPTWYFMQRNSSNSTGIAAAEAFCSWPRTPWAGFRWEFQVYLGLTDCTRSLQLGDVGLRKHGNGSGSSSWSGYSSSIPPHLQNWGNQTSRYVKGSQWVTTAPLLPFPCSPKGQKGDKVEEGINPGGLFPCAPHNWKVPVSPQRPQHRSLSVPTSSPSAQLFFKL